MLQYLYLIPIGVAVGAFGTLIGAGGGFVLMPLLLLLYPHEKTQVITSMSLAVVFFNTLSGSIAYARMRRIDYRSGLIFMAATLPGSVVGALATTHVPRRAFDMVFGAIMITASIYLFSTAGKKRGGGHESAAKKGMKICFTDASGETYRYSYNLAPGIAISVAVGFITSFLGIGGGIIHVSALTSMLDFPVHVATATSHFILAGTSLTATIVHIVTGAFTSGVRRTLFLAIGVVAGAQLGAFYSGRIKGSFIIRALALALALVGLRILLLAAG